jgi:hypothetical protein
MQSEQAKVPAYDLRRSLELLSAEPEGFVAEDGAHHGRPEVTLLLGEANFALL